MKLEKYILILLVVVSSTMFGQTNEETIFDEATIIYKHSIYGGAILHTNGWGANLAFTKNKTAFKARLLQFEMVGMKHPKEVRTYNPYYQDGRSYIFGKLNTLTIFRPSIGVRKIVFDKIRKSGVSIGYNWRLGPSLGFTKPVYLEVASNEGSPVQTIIVEKYDPDEHSIEDIYGRASWFKGIDELKLHPGIHAAFGLNFNYDSDRAGMNGIELGATIDYFPIEEIEVMAFADNYSVFFNFYLNLQFGKKFNK